MYKAIFRFLYTALLTGSLSVMNVPAHAANDALLELLKILRDKGGITQQEFELLRDTALVETGNPASPIAAETPAQTPADPVPQVVAAAKPSPEINTKGKLEFKTDEHKFRIGGRAQHDFTLVGNDGDGHVGSSEHQFRRARIYLSGTAWEHWDWKFQFDLEDADDSGMSIEDVFIRYKGLGPASITAGQRRAPFSLSALTSSKYITFIERAAPTDLFDSESIGIGGRVPGITLEHASKNHTLAGGFYLMRQRSESEKDSIVERKIDDGWGVTARATWLPVNVSGKQLVHAGAAFGYKHYPNKTVNRFRVRPGVSEGDRIVDSDGSITADNFLGMNLEAASIWGPFAASAEYSYGDFDGTGAAGATDMEGFYVQGSYFLTGENRRYKNGAFTSVKVKDPVGGGGWGAWEVGLRYSSTDLGAGIGADSGDVLTAALNWYVNDNMMFKLNYVRTFCDSGGSDTCDWGIGDGDPEYLSFRTQVFF
ncbi:MAG: porin [Gammaproteobacteria bacterium]|nr:porin [Gammaproteobacteria bacterium]